MLFPAKFSFNAEVSLVPGFNRHSAPRLDVLKFDVEIKIEMHIFHVASREDMDLWTNFHHHGYK